MQAPRGAFLLKAPTSFRRRITIADDIHNRRATMIIGTPREIKNHEYRVGLTPESARELVVHRSEEHTSELQSLMRISYAVFCLKKKKSKKKKNTTHITYTNNTTKQ